MALTPEDNSLSDVKDGSNPIPLLQSRDENCPSCGKPLADDNAVVCVKCGFDLRSVQVRPTIVGPPVEPTADSLPKPKLDAKLNWKVALGFAGACLLVMIVAYLAGARGLFPNQEGQFANAEGQYVLAAPPAAVRLVALLRYLLFRMVLVGCGLLALQVHAHLRSRVLGPTQSSLAALGAIVSGAGLITLVSLPHQGFERFIEIVGEGGVAVLALMVVFRLRPVEAVMAVAVALLVIVLAVLGAHVIVWIV